MKHIISAGIALLLLTAAAAAQNVTLPFDLVDTLDGVKFKIRVPANWNKTLLLYMQASKTGPPPAEPLVVPPVVDAAQPSLEATLLSRGYALAASEVGVTDMQQKDTVQDTFALASYFRGRVGNPSRVILWGSSQGGMTALKMVEDYPRSFQAAIPMCAAGAGLSRRTDSYLDFAVAYAVALGWPEGWGPLEHLREGLDFNLDVLPKMLLPSADGSNRGQWEFIRLVIGQSSPAFWTTCPVNKVPGFLMEMWAATTQRAMLETYAGGPVAQNLGRRYTLKPEEKAYLAGLGVNAEDLLAKMNAHTNIAADGRARDYIQRFGDLRGMLGRPALALHNTDDGSNPVNHESSYLAAVEDAGRADYLVQTYVPGVGHCAFTSKQLLLALAAVESWLDTGVKPDASFLPAVEGFDNTFVPPPWPY